MEASFRSYTGGVTPPREERRENAEDSPDLGPAGPAGRGASAHRRSGDTAQQLLAAADRVLASSLEYGETLANVARLAVPALADWCIVDVVEPDGRMRRVATAHVDPAKESLMHDVQRRYPPDRNSPQPAARVIRTGKPELLPDVSDEVVTAHARDAEHARLIRALGLRSHLAVPLVARGRVVGALSLGIAESGRRHSATDVPLAEELARRCAVAVENARLYREAQDRAAEQVELNSALREAAEARDRALTEVEASRARLAFLSEASQRLASSLDYEATLATVAQLAVPVLADWCAVDVGSEDGSIQRLATAHADPAKTELARELTRRYPPDPGASRGAPAVLRSGQAELYPTITDELLTQVARNAEHLALLREIGLTAAIVVPMATQGRTLGALTLAWAESGRRYDEDDLATAQELASRCALALDNARLYAAERRARSAAEAAQQRLRELFMQAPAAIAVLRGPQHVFEFVNPRYAALVGGRDVLRKPARDAFPELEKQGLFELLDHVYATRQPFVGTEVPVRWDRLGRGDLEEGHFNFVYQPYRETDAASGGGHDGGIEGILVHAVEVTDQVRARQRIETLAAERDTFLAAASHDLKNPLTSIKGTVQILRRQLARSGAVPLDRLAAGLEMIEATGEHMLALINELLDVTRIRMGQSLALDPRPTDLVALARRAVETQQEATDRHTVRLEAPPGEVVGAWDPTRLGRVLNNLLANAVKYSPQGGDVVVAIRREDGAGGAWALLSVRDQGLGIPETDQERIFEAFGRGSNVAGIAGAGLGLASARQIVEQHGGTIAVESTPGHGTLFTVRLPIEMEDRPR